MKISLKFVPKFRINNIPVVAWIWPEWATWFHLGFCLSQRFFFYKHAVTCKYVNITFLQHWKCYYFSAGEAEW